MSTQPSFLRFCLPAILSAFYGCGQVKSAAGLAPPVHNDAFEAVLGHGEFTDRSNEISCLALRGEVDLARDKFEASSEMSSVVRTDDYKKLDDAYSSYKYDSCPSITDDHDHVSDACTELGENVVSAWNDLQLSPAWETAKGNSDYQELVAKWKKAKDIGCISH